ncbi:MAG: C40 family peptidase [Bacteroidales bacterium]|nr:C40 family peptidase [Bacteroidales bacterium]
MNYGICDLSVIPIRKEGSHTSEMVSQLLYNEVYEVLDEKPGWKLIRTTLDQYEGWIQGIQYHGLDTDAYHEILAKEKYIVDRPTLAYKGRLLSIGTVINEPAEGTMMMSGRFSPAMMIEFAQKFMDAPYLWGGRSIFGIDCSGFVQLCARAAGKLLPRDASRQINEGELVYFLPEIQPGDLAFFGNENGQIVHVGMMLDTERILHASGQVRIDYLDQTGIFNKERNEHTHRLQVIKRIS